MVDFKRLVGLITVECCCWNTLLTAKAACWIAWDRLCFMVIPFSFYKFFVVVDGISGNDFFRPFLKAIMGSVLKVSLQLWFACNMCQCFVIISFKFGNDRLCYWLRDALFIMSFLLMEQLFSIELVNLPKLLCDDIYFVSFINKLFNKFSIVTVLVLECWSHSSN